ncbi:Hypothetical protein SMAX5B_002912 [Scophthalmus maximus]|uniref:HECT domain-containing protein n=1 Tax=Scophthalmus maximus TaxID=52904 RepID=A0A2U9BEH7_SCOMX|nr:Hypothetical protein SMAX5B_002912 [Scophthalmus maximus]
MTVNAAQLDASYGVRSTEATCWHQHSETTPTSSEEFELSQAGLGKRHLTMSRDMSHEEFIGLLQNEYPKMQGLKGGWLLYKATGGQGKRRLIMIPPDSDAYTGTLIRSATTAGKITLYISPLQHEFDLSPLPPDAIEFQSMPRAQCQTCNVSFPLQILALHVQECMESQAGSEDIEVDLSTEDSIQGLSDEILNCGYTGAISVQNKESIVRAIILHAVLRLQPMLEQLREGLQLYDLLLLMSHYPEICQPLFVPQEDAKLKNVGMEMTKMVHIPSHLPGFCSGSQAKVTSHFCL